MSSGTTKAALGLAVILCLSGGTVMAQGKLAAARLSDMMLYENRAYGVMFAEYRARVSSTAAVIGLGQGATSPAGSHSTINVRSESAPGLGPRDRTLARNLAVAFCAYHGLAVGNEVDADWQDNGVWVFRNLCRTETAG